MLHKELLYNENIVKEFTRVCLIKYQKICCKIRRVFHVHIYQCQTEMRTFSRTVHCHLMLESHVNFKQKIISQMCSNLTVLDDFLWSNIKIKFTKLNSCMAVILCSFSSEFQIKQSCLEAVPRILLLRSLTLCYIPINVII